MLDTVDRMIWDAEDRWRYQPKHVEQCADINKMYIAASCWVIIDTYQYCIYKFMRLYGLKHWHRRFTINRLKIIYFHSKYITALILNYLLHNCSNIHDVKYSRTVAKFVATCFGQSRHIVMGKNLHILESKGAFALLDMIKYLGEKQICLTL